jgi:Sulfotransferase family
MMIRTVKRENRRSPELTLPSVIYQKASSALVRFVPYFPSDRRYNITICNEKKFVWFRVSKVGTRTIFNVFDQADIKLDAEHAMSCHYPASLYRGHFKFAFVRNPWDRLVSCWRNKVVDSNYFHFTDAKLPQTPEFGTFVDFVADLNIETCDHHLRLQSQLIDLNEIDYLGRFESFEEDLLEVVQTIGLGPVNIEKHNVSRSERGYRQYYDEGLKAKVAKVYRKDIKLFAYEF